MKRLLLCAAVTFAVIILPTPERLVAHHAFSAEFDAKKPVKLKGTISKFEWYNPHSWLYIDATEIDGKPVEDGKAVPWALEFGSSGGLTRLGWRKDSLPVGEVVTVDAYRAKNGTNTANARAVLLANGKRLFAGSSVGGAEGPQ